jgi:protein gp37
MSTTTTIEWTEVTWNPVTGCTKLSQGCKHCYAERLAERFWGDRPFTDIQIHPERLDQPRRWRRPRTVFVNSMSDLFHEDVPTSFIAAVFDVMYECPQHTFQVLTKRADRLSDLAGRLRWPPNVWMGVSVENKRVVSRIDRLRNVPAAVRFLSLEPLIGPLEGLALGGVDWVIVGGESGPGARPMKTEWVDSIYRQCRQAGAAFFFKQWGGVVKAKTGRALHGRTYDEYPQPRLLRRVPRVKMSGA